jgi:hypothetical protein
MSLFGAKKKEPLKEILKRARENFEVRMTGREDTLAVSDTSSSHVGEQLEAMGRGPQQDLDYEGTATTFEVAGGGEAVEEKQEENFQPPAITLPRDVFNKAVRIHNQQAREQGHPSQVVSPAYSVNKDKEGNKYEKARVYTISSDDGSSLSPPPTTDYGGSQIPYPDRTQCTKYGGSIVAFPPSAVPQDPFSTPRASVKAGIIASKYIQSEENITMHTTEEEENKGVQETL